VARIRTIKPEFFTSEDIVELSPLARLLYIALWCESDKKGRLLWKPRTFKIRYFPADACNIEELCAELVRGGLVRLYGEGLAFIPAFTTHQHINPRESESVLPDPDASTTRQQRVPHASPRDSDAQGGREGKGKEGKTRDASGDPPGFAVFWEAYPLKKARQDAVKAWAKLSPDPDLWQSIGGAVGRQKRSDAWRKDGGKFIPHAATWLNGRRWEDQEAAPEADDQFAGAL
jgi:hypothetical protein